MQLVGAQYVVMYNERLNILTFLEHSCKFSFQGFVLIIVLTSEYLDLNFNIVLCKMFLFDLYVFV